MRISRFKLGRIQISEVDQFTTLKFLKHHLDSKQNGYVCVTNSRTAHLANTNEHYCHIQNNSILTLPDGMPLVLVAKKMGLNNVGKVSGKDLMDELFNISKINSYSHYFYGCSEETLNQMVSNIKKKYPGINICGYQSPPFQPVEDFDIEGLAEILNDLRPTFFWCGLGAPKQELIISKLQPKLNHTISLGVGLAFEYFANTISRAPLWMRNSGLEWTYRLFQQPKNIKREIIPMFWIIFQILQIRPKRGF